MDMSEIWPPYQLVITAGDLELKIIRDDDLPEFVDLVLDGVHDPDFMPFSAPWTDAPAAELPANFARFHWSVRSGFSREHFALDFAVRRNGELVGSQGFSTHDYAITRTGETGSWLARRFHGQGIGTRMRQAVCAFVFEELGAVQVTSGAFDDNPASLGVSRKVGYRPNGIKRMARRGEAAINQQLLLKPEDFNRGEPIAVTGADALRRFLQLDVEG
ncbi:GNAT family N-acetyltransferase [Microlunatus elymi]|uniref:GNAT family N-acetyltransferase n=1 Tax=Microlunatus elymi TaxID=2596828 RepID=A0A516Q1D8_9ACTN|nr:GNAT family protein [Microlunatus elymi]QDP97247.1 GNAT family N-acetyltransferase [Microlunatus elymi]